MCGDEIKIGGFVFRIKSVSADELNRLLSDLENGRATVDDLIEWSLDDDK